MDRKRYPATDSMCRWRIRLFSYSVSESAYQHGKIRCIHVDKYSADNTEYIHSSRMLQVLVFQAMVVAFSCVNILILMAWQYVAHKYMGLSWTDVVKDIIPFGVIAAATMVVTYIVTLSISNIYILLISRIAIAAVIYYILMRFLHVSILRECMAFLKIKFLKIKHNYK